MVDLLFYARKAITLCWKKGPLHLYLSGNCKLMPYPTIKIHIFTEVVPRNMTESGPNGRQRLPWQWIVAFLHVTQWLMPNVSWEHRVPLGSGNLQVRMVCGTPVFLLLALYVHTVLKAAVYHVCCPCLMIFGAPAWAKCLRLEWCARFVCMYFYMFCTVFVRVNKGR